MKLPKPCAVLACPAIVPGGQRFCAQHQRELNRYYDARRPSYNSRRPRGWAKLRQEILARDPVCTICGQAPSTAVDHIVNRDKTRGQEVVPGIDDPANLRGVCRSCHSRRTMNENVRPLR